MCVCGYRAGSPVGTLEKCPLVSCGWILDTVIVITLTRGNMSIKISLVQDNTIAIDQVATSGKQQALVGA